MTVVGEVEQFILDELGLAATVDRIEPDADLLGSGIVDSFGLGELIVFMEEHYGVTVGADELTPENFASPNTIAAFIESRALDRAS